MRELLIGVEPGRAPCVLFLGAHSDDIEIGCGATVLRLAEEIPDAEIHWVVFSAVGDREKEAEASAEDFLSACPSRQIELHRFRDAYFPDSIAEIKDVFENLKTRIAPDLIFTHHRNDLHQDHKVVSDLTWNTYRNHRILEYEIPKYDGDLGNPNLFVSVSPEQLQAKLEKLHRHFPTQQDRRWFSKELFSGLMRLRGLHGGSPSGLAEAYYSRKALIP